MLLTWIASLALCQKAARSSWGSGGKKTTWPAPLTVGEHENEKDKRRLQRVRETMQTGQDDIFQAQEETKGLEEARIGQHPVDYSARQARNECESFREPCAPQCDEGDGQALSVEKCRELMGQHGSLG